MKKLLHRFLFFLLLAGISVEAIAQLSPERQAMSRMQKGKWRSARESLQKALRKDSLNAEARFLFAAFYFSTENPERNIDSSYHYAVEALRDYSLLTGKEKERLMRYPLDSIILVNFRMRIDSAAFERAKATNTESACESFLKAFPLAKEGPSAVELRNEIAFIEALKVNTYESFQKYFQKYPSSGRAEEARKRYERLLFEDKTKGGRLKDYTSFFNHYPESPYRVEAERHVFEIMTASGKISSFMEFISSFPDSRFREKAEAVLFHLKMDEEGNDAGLNDSLKNVLKNNQGFLVPVLQNGKFGFIDDRGSERISPRFDSIPQEYRCGNIRTDYVIADGSVMSRSGKILVKGPALGIIDVGFGFLKANIGGCWRMYHKSGFTVPEGCPSDVKLIGHSFIAWQTGGKWGLVSLLGRALTPSLFDDIFAVDDVVVFVRSGKKTMVTLQEVASLADQQPFPTSRVFDDVRRIGPNQYVVTNGSLEGILDGSLGFVLPLDRQQVLEAKAGGFILRKEQHYRLEHIASGLEAGEYDNVLFYGPWIRLTSLSREQLFQLPEEKMIIPEADSIWFQNNLAFVRRNDSLSVIFKSGTMLDFSASEGVTFLKSVDSTNYFIIKEKNKRSVFDAVSGDKLFSFDFDEAEYLGQGLFLVTRNNKKGVINNSGKIVLPVEYSAIVPAGHHVVSIYKDKKFGAFNLKSKKLLKPAFDRNIMVIPPDKLVAYKDQGYGFITWDFKSTSPFEFEEIRPWNDSSFLVKKNFQWLIFQLPSARIGVQGIKDYHVVSDSPHEKIVIVHRENHYGIMSNVRGEILPATFSDIINVGSEDNPLYFAEKKIEEAGIEVVIYYDARGKLLRKQVYEEEDYERIVCDQ
jgi:tetratricopeptide (TPR) repeat protein